MLTLDFYRERERERMGGWGGGGLWKARIRKSSVETDKSRHSGLVRVRSRLDLQHRANLTYFTVTQCLYVRV